jgi:hypothetical protein
VRVPSAIAVAAMVLLVGGCTGGTAHLAAARAPLPPDPHTASALLKIAAAFNHDYDTCDYQPVYPITRAQRRHPTARQPAKPSAVTLLRTAARCRALP